MGFDTTEVVFSLIKIGIVLVLLLQITPVMSWVERRGAGLIQHRRGPNRVRPFGLIQALADALKFIVPLFKIVKKQKTVREKLAEVMACANGAKLRVKHYSTGTLTVGGLRALLRRLQSISFYPDLLLLDYADDMDLTEFRGRDGEEDRDYGPLGSLYKALRGLAGDLRIPIWTASQTNRDGADKEVLSIKDFADSFRKAAVSDVVLAVAQNPSEVNTRTARLILAKNRNGPMLRANALMALLVALLGLWHGSSRVSSERTNCRP